MTVCAKEKKYINCIASLQLIKTIDLATLVDPRSPSLVYSRHSQQYNYDINKATEITSSSVSFTTILQVKKSVTTIASSQFVSSYVLKFS